MADETDEKEKKGAAVGGDDAEKSVKADKPVKAAAKAASAGKAAAAGAPGPAEKQAKAEKAPKQPKVAAEAGAPGPAEKQAKAEIAPEEPKVAAEAGAPAAPARTGGKRKDKKNIPFAIANIHATFNNTVITISDQAGNVLSWSSAGCVGFKGSRKGTPFAAQLAAQAAGNAAREHGVRQVEVRVKGPGSGRESSIRAMQAIGLEVKSIKDVTPIPHNGCRPPKRRRT